MFSEDGIYNDMEQIFRNVSRRCVSERVCSDWEKQRHQAK